MLQSKLGLYLNVTFQINVSWAHIASLPSERLAFFFKLVCVAESQLKAHGSAVTSCDEGQKLCLGEAQLV